MCQTLLGTRRQRQLIFGPSLEETQSGWERHFIYFLRGRGGDILNRQTEKSVTEILMAIVQIAVETEKTLKSILNKDLKMKTSKRR